MSIQVRLLSLPCALGISCCSQSTPNCLLLRSLSWLKLCPYVFFCFGADEWGQPHGKSSWSTLGGTHPEYPISTAAISRHPAPKIDSRDVGPSLLHLRRETSSPRTHWRTLGMVMLALQVVHVGRSCWWTATARISVRPIAPLWPDAAMKAEITTPIMICIDPVGYQHCYRTCCRSSWHRRERHCYRAWLSRLGLTTLRTSAVLQKSMCAVQGE